MKSQKFNLNHGFVFSVKDSEVDTIIDLQCGYMSVKLSNLGQIRVTRDGLKRGKNDI